MISVIMPTYNSEKYIKDAIDSIRHQTYTDWEMLVIDDESTDTTRKIVTEYEHEDCRIRLLTGPKNGIGAALNYGVDRAQGNYIARMDSDDISYSERFEKQLSFMETHTDVGVCATNFQIFNCQYKGAPMYKQHRSSEKIATQMLFECAIAHPTVMFRKSILEQGWRYAENVIAEDYDLWTRMVPNVNFACLDEVLLAYRMEEQNLTFRTGKKVMAETTVQCIRTCIARIFDMNLDKYQNATFYFDESMDGDAKLFLKEQAHFLIELDEKNQIYRAFNQQVLHETMQEHWTKALDFWGLSNQDAYGNFYELLDGRAEWTSYEEKINEEIDSIRELAAQRQKFVLYGMGIRGKRALADYLKLHNASKTQWVMDCLIDKRAEKVLLDGTEYEVKSPDILKNLQEDMVLITTVQYFDEIKNNLLDIGLKENQIYSASILKIMGSNEGEH